MKARFALVAVFVGVFLSAKFAFGQGPVPVPGQGSELRPLGYYSGDPLPVGVVYLSFDDGPSDFTEAILDTLLQKQVKATFFINSFDRNLPKDQLGTVNYLPKYKAVLTRMLADGHLIGNHSFSHKDFATLDATRIAFELDTLQGHLNEVLGPTAPRLHLIRPPWGSPWYGSWGTKAQQRRAAAVVAKRGWVINWTEAWNSGDSNEWVAGEWWNATDKRYHPGGKDYLAKQERMLQKILTNADGRQGGIILMHDIHPTSRDLLPRLIDALRQRGYRFDTLDHYLSWRWPNKMPEAGSNLAPPIK